MKDLNDMMVFLLVVEQGGFTAAADKIGLPKSNISRKVSRLEQALGVRLLERSTRRHHLTEIGQLYHQHCLRIREEMQSAELSIQQLAAKPVGTLKVCTSVSIGQGLLSPLLAEFKRQYPDVDIELSLTNRRVDMIEEGFDITVRVGQLAESNLVAKLLCSKSLYLYASPDTIARIALLSEPGDLAGADCLYMNAVKRKPQWQLHREDGNDAQISKTQVIALKPKVSCDDFNVLRQLALDHAGIACLPDYLCQQEVSAGRLVRVLPDWRFDTVKIHALFPSHKGATPKVRAFLDFLQRSLGI